MYADTAARMLVAQCCSCLLVVAPVAEGYEIAQDCMLELDRCSIENDHVLPCPAGAQRGSSLPELPSQPNAMVETRGPWRNLDPLGRVETS